MSKNKARTVGHAEYVEATANLALRVVKNITGRPDLKYTRVNGLGFPAGTDGDTVYVDNDFIGALATRIEANPNAAFRHLAVLKGVLYHEGSHVRWTQRPFYTHEELKNDRDLHRAWNILEDQRIECLLVGTSPRTANYLTPAILDWVIADASGIPTVHHAIHGRRYLDPQLRKTAKLLWSGDGDADRIGEIIDTYIDSYYDLTEEEVLALAREFKDLTANLPGSFDGHPDDKPGKGKNDGSQPIGKDWAETGEEAEEGDSDEDAPKVPGKPGEGDDKDDAGSGEGDDQEGDGEGSEGSQEGQDGPDGADGQDGDGEGSSGDQEDDQDGENGPAAGSGSSIVPHRHEARRQFVDALHEALNDPDLREDLNNDLERVQKDAFTNNGAPFQPRKLDYYEHPVPAIAQSLPRTITNVLKPITARLRPGWRGKQDRGEVVVIDYKTRRPGEPVNFFRKYHPDRRSDASLDVVILIDRSGSMDDELRQPTDPDNNTALDESCLTAWAIKSAIDQLPQSRCAVGLFDDTNNHADVLYRHEERADRLRYRTSYCGGGTDPASALNEWALAFDQSTARHKVLIIITDGAWNNAGRTRFGTFLNANDIIAKYKASGVHTALFGVSGDTWGSPDVVARYGLHNCHEGRDLNRITDLPNIVREIITNKIRSH